MNGKTRQIANSAIELLQELREPEIVPKYNKILIEKCFQQIGGLYAENINTLLDLKSGENHQNDNVVHMLRIRQTAIDHIKRCCCAYINERMLRIRKLRWKAGGRLSENVKANLSEHELKWLNKYNELILNFQNEFGDEENENDDLNLLNLFDPPGKLLVKVRALEDGGQFETSDGIGVTLNKGSFHLLPKHDCENLVRRGILEYV